MSVTRSSSPRFLVYSDGQIIVQSGASGEGLGWVDLDLGSSPGWWADIVATYCPSRMVELPKSKSTQQSPSPDAPDCITDLLKNWLLYMRFLLYSDVQIHPS